MTLVNQDQVAYRLASHPGEIISCDLLDLRNLPVMNEERYVSVIIDHFTGYTVLRQNPFAENRGY